MEHFNIYDLVRENIKNMKSYSSARDEYAHKRGIFLDANESPFGSLSRYPDPYQVELKNEIGLRKKIAASNIFIGNGSDEVIDLLFRVFCKPSVDKVLSFSPTYGMYQVAAALNDVELIDVPLTADFQLDIKNITPFLYDKNIKLMFICSPNNPTGNTMNVQDIEFLLQNFQGIVAIDEAYIDFSEQKSFIEKISQYPNLVVMQTFSKALASAAIRVGMAFSNPEIILYLNKTKPPYNVSELNQQAAIAQIRNYEETDNQIVSILENREKLIGKLRNFTFVKKIYPSEANFLLVEVADANHLYEYLTRKFIVVRNRNTVVENCLRISVGSSEENFELIDCLEKYQIL